ncbi:MAG: hypothetical protein V1881_00860, partial [Candidatus Micrarchaeota archaeon]
QTQSTIPQTSSSTPPVKVTIESCTASELQITAKYTGADYFYNGGLGGTQEGFLVIKTGPGQLRRIPVRVTVETPIVATAASLGTTAPTYSAFPYVSGTMPTNCYFPQTQAQEGTEDLDQYGLPDEITIKYNPVTGKGTYSREIPILSGLNYQCGKLKDTKAKLKTCSPLVLTYDCKKTSEDDGCSDDSGTIEMIRMGMQKAKVVTVNVEADDFRPAVIQLLRNADTGDEATFATDISDAKKSTAKVKCGVKITGKDALKVTVVKGATADCGTFGIRDTGDYQLRDIPVRVSGGRPPAETGPQKYDWALSTDPSCSPDHDYAKCARTSFTVTEKAPKDPGEKIQIQPGGELGEREKPIEVIVKGSAVAEKLPDGTYKQPNGAITRNPEGTDIITPAPVTPAEKACGFVLKESNSNVDANAYSSGGLCKDTKIDEHCYKVTDFVDYPPVGESIAAPAPPAIDLRISAAVNWKSDAEKCTAEQWCCFSTAAAPVAAAVNFIKEVRVYSHTQANVNEELSFAVQPETPLLLRVTTASDASTTLKVKYVRSGDSPYDAVTAMEIPSGETDWQDCAARKITAASSNDKIFACEVRAPPSSGTYALYVSAAKSGANVYETPVAWKNSLIVSRAVADWSNLKLGSRVLQEYLLKKLDQTVDAKCWRVVLEPPNPLKLPSSDVELVLEGYKTNLWPWEDCRLVMTIRKNGVERYSPAIACEGTSSGDTHGTEFTRFGVLDFYLEGVRYEKTDSGFGDARLLTTVCERLQVTPS